MSIVSRHSRILAIGLAALLISSKASAQEFDVDTEPLVVSEEDRAEQEALRDAFEQYGSVGFMLLGQSDPQKVVLCSGIAKAHAGMAAAATDKSIREARFEDVWRFEQRLANPLEDARRELGEEGFKEQQYQAAQAIGMLLMIRDPKAEELYEETGDLMFAFSGSLAFRCGQILDDMGIPRVEGRPSAEYIAQKTRYRWRGLTYDQVFAETDLGPFAKDMCVEGIAPDFSDAPFDQRGNDGMSLLDWAIECNDRASFDALVQAGFDLNAQGLWENPPLVNSASKAKIWFLTRLLDEGVNPDTQGRSDTALKRAYNDLDAINAGDTSRVAFNLLRSRGASLSFPNFHRSIWSEWAFRFPTPILENWDEFDSDAVELGSMISFGMSAGWVQEKHLPAAEEVVKRLNRDFGVCFPIESKPDSEWDRDERGFKVQTNCPKAK